MNKLLTFLVLLLTVVTCANDIVAQSKRKTEKYKRADGTTITCVRPPPDVLTTSNVTTVDAKIPKLVDILKSGGGAGLSLNQQKEVRRIREELSNLNIYEVMEYRLCVQTGSNVRTLEEYKLATDELRKPLGTPPASPALANPSESQANTEPQMPINISSVKFFEGDGQNVPSSGTRVYSNSFKASSRYIYFELTATPRVSSKRTVFTVGKTYYHPLGFVFCSKEFSTDLSANETSGTFYGSCAPQSGVWEAGTYNVVLTINGKEASRSSFKIE